ncbi:hypothetical protein AB0I37_06220 [Micromonospora purpureochromogenes]|uniref:hypothetical protein n=1 Tax=Micromonospora purpureochromogenes TaxID=47872 RepID=UPI0033E37E7E
MRAAERSDTVLFVVYDGVRLLDVTGPLEVFTVANEHGGTYRLVLASPDGRDVVSSAGVRLGADVALSEVTGPSRMAGSSSAYAKRVKPSATTGPAARPSAVSGSRQRGDGDMVPPWSAGSSAR